MLFFCVAREALMIMHRKQSVNIFGCDAWLLVRYSQTRQSWAFAF